MCSRDNPKCELMHISREGWETKRNLPTVNLILKIIKYNIKSWKHCQNLGRKEDFEKKKSFSAQKWPKWPKMAKNSSVFLKSLININYYKLILHFRIF